MLITVTATGVDVLDANVLTALSVRTELEPADTERALIEDGLARVAADPSPGHVWLDVDELARRTMSNGDAAWRDRWDAMVDYAAGKGWTDPDRTMIRAHVETTP